MSLLNEAREKTESYIDILYEPLKGRIDKPRTYRKLARQDYLATAKMTFQEATERYRLRHGFYPESVHVDKIYRTRGNILYCLERGIRIRGTRLGRPPKEQSPVADRIFTV